MSTHATIRQYKPTNRNLLIGGLLVNSEIVAILYYYAVIPANPTELLYLVYPFIWINVGLWGVSKVSLPDAPFRRRLVAYGIGVGYFLLLGGIGGLFMLHGEGLGARIAWLPPGWGPAFLYSGSSLTLTLFPYKIVGYGALAYLVTATVLDAANTGLAGFLGLFSCVSCTWPVAATVLTGVFGSASVLASVATNSPHALSTVVFVSSVLLLMWRPGW